MRRILPGLLHVLIANAFASSNPPYIRSLENGESEYIELAQALPPNKDRFLSVSPTNIEALSDYVSPFQKNAIRNLINERNCPEVGMKLFRSSKAATKTMVLTVPCDPPIRSNSVGGRYFEYPLTIALYEDIVAEVDLPSYRFIYDTGRLRFITDLDKNGAPEFWLTGDVCEPGPDDPGPRSCHGTIAIELQKGALRVWKNKPYVK